MELSFRALARESDIDQTPFQPGERVVSFLLRNNTNEVARVDIRSDQEESFQPEGDLLCRWTQVIRKKDTSEAEIRQQLLQSTEDIFLSLYELEEQNPDAEPDRDREQLKFFLALQLERKRVLRPEGSGIYRHVRLKKQFRVPQLELTPEILIAAQQRLHELTSI